MRADVVVCGAGIAGVAAAWHLARRARFPRVLLVERDAPLSLTSDKSTECYRNWWQGPGDAMVAFANHSIDLMEALALDTGNTIGLDRRGYLYLSADPAMAAQLARTAEQSQALGAGRLRTFEGTDHGYQPGRADGFQGQPDGADLLVGRELVRRHFPYASREACVALHVRRCGALSAQQLGMVMLEQARARGVELVRGEVEGIETGGDGVRAVRLRLGTEQVRIECPRVVDAAGPYLSHLGKMVGLDLPVVCERHAKLTFDDRAGVFPRSAPLTIWCDRTWLPWSDEERALLRESPLTEPLTGAFPAGVHGRPLGTGVSAMLYWTYDCPTEEPRFPVTWDPHYPEILMRGMSVMVPGLCAYYQHIPKAYVDGGYYTKTRENRPIIGPTPVPGFHLLGAFSGFGIMTAMAGGDLLADHLTGAPLPGYARALSLARYADDGYRALLANWPASGQI